jgi:hypothetical protein
MVQQRCEICGQPAAPSPLGTLLCTTCRARYREFRCSVCRVRVLTDISRGLGMDDGICSTCQLRARLARISEGDREAIRMAASRGTLVGIKELRTRLGWSIREAVDAVELLRVCSLSTHNNDCGPQQDLETVNHR